MSPPPRRAIRALLPVVLAGLASLAACASAPVVTQVVIVRHAEKADDGTRDPALSDRGQARAGALAAVLRDAGVGAVYATQFQRTQATVAPLAAQAGVRVEVVDAGQSEALAATIRARHLGQVVLVAAHSNTVPRLIAALGGPTLADLAEGAFDDLFVVTLAGDGPARVLHLKYAAPATP